MQRSPTKRRHDSSFILSPSLAKLVAQLQELLILILFHAFSVLVDILITIGLTLALRKTKTSFSRTRSLLQRLVIYTSSRGIVIVVVQLAHMAMYFIDSANLLFWFSMHLILSKIYVNSTLVM
ncbi:hypothetical protein H2248_005472 [Termitomyces sp. 'cryptogamus']|nr:hypothetical protein H2248_005472 [Termitomyces sp. 'cryptogamus']